MNFFLCVGIILLIGGILGFLLNKIKMPALLGYLALGIVLGSFNLMNESLIVLSSQLRKIALIIILLKAGLSLNVQDLKKVGRPAILLSLLPCTIEMCTVGLVGHYLLNLTFTESFLLGSVLGAVSPAVVVPRMSKMLDEKQGTKEGIPQMIIAGSSMDDIVMIVFYTVFLSIESGTSFGVMTFLNIPISIISGIIVGIILGFLYAFIFSKIHIQDTLKLIILLSTCFLLVYLEDFLSTWFSYSSLLSAISMGIVILTKRKEQAKRLANRCNKIWVVAEIFLFTLVGAAIQIKYALNVLGFALIVITIGLIFRNVGVQLSLIGTKTNIKERTFISIAYLPKATVQAAIGGGLLDLGNSLNSEAIIASGTIVLSVAVVSILFTAPLGAILIDKTYTHLTLKETE